MNSVANLALIVAGLFAAHEIFVGVKARKYRRQVEFYVTSLLNVTAHPALGSAPVLTHVRFRFENGVPSRDTAEELVELLAWWGPFDLTR